MLYLRSWLSDFIDLNEYSNEELKNIITIKSGEVEEVLELTDYYAGKVKIGRIKNLRQHPNADRLKIFDLDLGDNQEQIQIVSAAPNSENGLLVVVATVGTELAMGSIQEREMRGYKSQGMCLGMSELLLETEDSSGLWEIEQLVLDKDINPEQVLGQSICSILPEYFPEDTIFDIKYLADKISSCGNHLGLALEIATCLERPELLTTFAQKLLDPTHLAETILNYAELGNKELKVNFSDRNSYSNSFFLFDLQFDKHYLLPHQLQARMFLTKNNLVGGIADLSNYLLHDIGQPSHFFSKAQVLKLNQNQNSLNWEISKITESPHFEGLGKLKNIAIPEGVSVLKQQEEVIAIPGISGSNHTKTTEKDMQILVEIANFPNENIARSSFKLNYRSEAARIWAGKVQITLQFVVLVRLIDILYKSQLKFSISSVLNYLDPELCKAYKINKEDNFLQIATKILETHSKASIKVDMDYISSRLDSQKSEYWKEIVIQKLKIIGKYSGVRLYPNIFYQPAYTQEDVLEQVSRLIGYDSLASQKLTTHNLTNSDKSFESLSELKNVFLDYGFLECISRPFVAEADLKLLNPPNPSTKFVQNNLYTNLLQNASKNILFGEKDIRLFEYTKLYNINANNLEEKRIISSVLVNDDPYILTSLIKEIANKLGITDYSPSSLGKDQQYLGSGYSYTLGTTDINLIKISNKQKRVYNIPLTKNVYCLELDITNWSGYINNYPKYYNESNYSILSRQYSHIINNETQLQDVLDLIQNSKINDVDIRVYPLERIAEDKKYILNYKVDFVSYIKNLEGSKIDEWEAELLCNSNNILKLR
ncbi:MAG: phenylalanine--tRNA ligase beta subunit-related protein [Patescibacteria group bacterium]